MGIKLLMGICCFLPCMLILYAVMYFEGKRKGNIMFGITLWEGALDGEAAGEIEALQKKYKKNLMLANLIIILLFAVCCIPSRTSVYMSMLLMLMLVMLIIYFVPFAYANKKLKKMKYKSFGEVLSVSGESMAVDMTAAVCREPVRFAKIGIAGTAVGILPFILEIFMDMSGDMHGYNLLILGTMAAVGIICCIFLFYLSRLRADVMSNDSRINIQIARVRNYQWSMAFVIMIWANAVFNFYIWLRMGDMSADATEIIIVSLIYAAVLTAVMFNALIKITKVQNKYADSFIVSSDDDKYWLWGMLYCNKNDNRLMVNKRAGGMGSTINLAKPAGKIIMALTFILTAASLIGSSIYMLLADFTPIRLRIENDRLIAEQLSEEYNIPLNAVNGAELLEEPPDISKRVGTAMDSIYKGSFAEREGKRKCEVLVRITDGPYIRLETDTGIYYLNDEEPENTKAVYQELLAAITAVESNTPQ